MFSLVLQIFRLSMEWSKYHGVRRCRDTASLPTRKLRWARAEDHQVHQNCRKENYLSLYILSI